mmetsp:Transcript_111804/g.216638  ORF Transcript_111804/g.216638 Transcript_111804/m.216638 type:complete len:127 (-) Transcript_111804:268-648(-)
MGEVELRVDLQKKDFADHPPICRTELMRFQAGQVGCAKRRPPRRIISKVPILGLISNVMIAWCTGDRNTTLFHSGEKRFDRASLKSGSSIVAVLVARVRPLILHVPAEKQEFRFGLNLRSHGGELS